MKKQYFGVTFRSFQATISEINGDLVTEALRKLKTKKISSLCNPDLQVFESKEDALKFKEDFKKAVAKIDLLKNRTIQGTPILYKRHYLALAQLGVKTKTVRNRRIKGEVGDVVYLHDQTFYVPARLTAITQDGDSWIYEYKVINAQTASRKNIG